MWVNFHSEAWFFGSSPRSDKDKDWILSKVEDSFVNTVFIYVRKALLKPTVDPCASFKVEGGFGNNEEVCSRTSDSRSIIHELPSRESYMLSVCADLVVRSWILTHNRNLYR